ncbi:MAG TPA: hypothetical protein VGS57_17935, partial [Thermoanaerobaculia bacterium]|nr:hypothetical protein [Thermoanaerobaculia bacterium]
MSLRDFLDKHPLAILTTVATAAVSTGAGVAGYLTTQRCEIDTATLELKHSSEVELLSAQIRSIERRVGDGSAYFDVTSLVIPSQKVSSLPKQYQSLEDGRIFVSVPDDPKWTFSETN